MRATDTAKTPIRILALLIMAALSITCGGDSGSGPAVEDTGPVTLAISLSVSSAMPSDDVDVDGVPGNMDVSSLYAEITAASGAQYASLMGRRVDGSVYMVAPLNADNPAAGGNVMVRVTNGDNVTSNTVSLDIESLPPATVTIDDIVTRMQALMDSRLAMHGRTRAELRAMDVASMTPVDYPLFIAQEILDSPDNPNSLRATVDGPVPFFENAALNFDIADRLLSRTGAIEFLDEESASVDSLVAEPDPDTLSTSLVPTTQSGGWERPVAAQITPCINMGDAGITNAILLHRAMSMSRFSIRRLDGASGRVVEDVSKVFTTLAMVPEPDAKALAKAVGGVVYVYKLLNEASSRILPSEFDNSKTTFMLHPDTFNEDGILGYWNQFRVTAVSEGWEMDEDILKALLKYAKFQDNGGVRNLFNGPGDPDLQKNFSSYVVSEAVKGIIGEATAGQDIIRVCPGVWPNIDCTFPNYSKPSIISGTSIRFIDGEHNTYEPNEDGVSQLRVETRPDRFGGALAFEIKPVEVKRIRVLIDPDRIEAEASEILSFDIRVENADDPDFNWTIPDGFSYIDFVGNTLIIQAPDTPWDPALLKARSQASTGIRQGMVDADPRDGVATITYKDSLQIRIDPGYKCLSNGEAFTFTPLVSGITDYTVIWKRVSGWGTIDQNGRYVAPPGGTTDDVISAEIEGHPEVIDYANVRVGACTCNYVIDVIGATFFHEEGGDVAYLFSDLPDGFHSFQFFFMLNEPETGFSINIGPTDAGPGPRPGDTGSFEAGMSFIAPGGSASWVTLDEPGTVTILEHTDTYMIANFSGTLVAGDEQNRTTVNVSGSFRAGNWVDRWPCE